MATKTFCDYCGKQVKGDLYTVSIFRGRDEATPLQQDACSSCAAKVEKMLGSA